MADIQTLQTVLAQHPRRSFALSELKSELATPIPDRTLRRWLRELVDRGVIERTGQLKGTRYQFSAPSVDLIQQITAPMSMRPPTTYSEEWVLGYVPNETFYLTLEQRALLRQRGQRSPIYGQAGTYIQKIYDRLLIDLSYNSARLEGNTYTLADTENLVLNGATAPGKLDAERIMILNHREAIQYMVRNVSTLSATEETVRTLHYLLADSLVAAGMAGQIRADSIGVSGTTYAPLEGKERLTRLLARLLDVARQIRDPFEQSLYLLGQLSYLQAFVDVNKRTARLACIIPLITQDFVPQSFVDVDRDDYLKATIVWYELNDVQPMADIYCRAYLRTCQHFDVSAQVVGFDEIAARYRPLRRAIVAEIVQSRIAPSDALPFIESRMTDQIDPSHRDKFKQDVLAELQYLDASRIGGLGITRDQLDAWLKLRRPA